jgi:hypothetical protein
LSREGCCWSTVAGGVVCVCSIPRDGTGQDFEALRPSCFLARRSVSLRNPPAPFVIHFLSPWSAHRQFRQMRFNELHRCCAAESWRLRALRRTAPRVDWNQFPVRTDLQFQILPVTFLCRIMDVIFWQDVCINIIQIKHCM